jgi:hypothetical protein
LAELFFVVADPDGLEGDAIAIGILRPAFVDFHRAQYVVVVEDEASADEDLARLHWLHLCAFAAASSAIAHGLLQQLLLLLPPPPPAPAPAPPRAAIRVRVSDEDEDAQAAMLLAMALTASFWVGWLVGWLVGFTHTDRSAARAVCF